MAEVFRAPEQFEGNKTTSVPYFILKAYILSLFFLVVVLFLAVGDAGAELFLHSLQSAFTSHYTDRHLDFGFSL